MRHLIKCLFILSLHKRECFFRVQKKSIKKKTETRLSISVKICSYQLLFLKYRINIQISHSPPVHNVKMTSRIKPAVLRFSFRLYSSVSSPFSISAFFRSFLNIFPISLLAEFTVSETPSFKRSFFSCFSMAFCSLASCLIRILSSNIF